jgi:hypothetical protein
MTVTPKRSAALLILVAYIISSPGRVLAQDGGRGDNDPRSLHSRATKARAAGQEQVDLGSFEGVPPDISSLDEALKSYSLFVVEPLTSETVVESGRDLITWHKARVIAKLSTAPASELAPSLSSVPVDMLPQDLPNLSNEMLLLYNGGVATVEGIKFTKRITDFPSLVIGKRYLCILSVSGDGKVAIMPLAGAGAFEVSPFDTLRPLGTRPHPILEDMRTSYGNSMSRLSSHVRQRVAK